LKSLLVQSRRFYDEAAEIQGIIESREHSHRLQLLDINRRYEEATAQYRN
jgi:hypothetical protein